MTRLLRSDKGRPVITPGTSLAMTWGFEWGDPSVLRPQDDSKTKVATYCRTAGKRNDGKRLLRSWET
ncbi:MAG: hypothetical protein JNK18_01675 [Cyclobacteriaceae bacterium]|nr:hypothetical protein [Cyclobacteriaceae bacterium]